MYATNSTRENKFDNLKGLAIFLVVLGHLTLFKKYDSIAFIRNFVFLIHLPLFFFVAGYFSKIGPDEPVKAFKRLVIPYLIFCIIWELFNVYYLGNPPKSSLFIHPGYMLWFLMSLFWLKITLPIMDRFKYPILISIIGYLLIGFISSNILGISRVFIYMPLFLLGFYYRDLKPKFIEKFPIIENNKFAVCILILTLITSVLIAMNLPYDVICRKYIYGDEWLWDMIIRMLLLAVTTLNVLVLTRFMTNEKIIITTWGINSISVFLLHTYVIKICKFLAKPYLKNHQKLTLVFMFVMAFVITYVLSRDFVRKGLNKLLELTYRILSLE